MTAQIEPNYVEPYYYDYNYYTPFGYGVGPEFFSYPYVAQHRFRRFHHEFGEHHMAFDEHNRKFGGSPGRFGYRRAGVVPYIGIASHGSGGRHFAMSSHIGGASHFAGTPHIGGARSFASGGAHIGSIGNGRHRS